MRRAHSIWLITLALFAANARASEFDPFGALLTEAKTAHERYLKTGSPQAVVTTWPEGLRTGQQILYREDQNLRLSAFVSQNLEYPPHLECENLLMASQIFPLSRIQKRSHLSDRQMRELADLIYKLDSRQFRFFEWIGEVNLPDFVQDVGLSSGQLGLGAALWHREKKIRTQATMWSVAAQTTDTFVAKQFQKMPWQLDDAYAGISLDREKYKSAWEVGRAAQDETGTHAKLSAMAALAMAREVLIRKESIDGAYVFAHTLGAAQNRLFKSAGLFKVHASHIAGQDEVLVAPLSEFLKTFPPEQVSSAIANLIAASRFNLSALAAMDILLTAETVTQSEFEVRVPRLGGIERPLILMNAVGSREVYINEASIRHNVQRFASAMNPVISREFLLVSGLRSIAEKDDPPIEALVPEQLFGLRNLDLQLAQNDPTYLRLMLMAAYYSYAWEIERLAVPIVQTYMLKDLRFAITQKTLAEQAYRIPGVQTVYVSWGTVRNELHVDPADHHLTRKPKVGARFATIPVIPIESVRRIIKEDPVLAREARHALRRGNSQVLSMLRGTF